MTSEIRPDSPATRRVAFRLTLPTVLIGLLAACSPATTGSGVDPSATSTATPNIGGDPRVGLRAGRDNAGQAYWNLRLLSNTPQPEAFAGRTNSDLAFSGNYAIQGNYHGWMFWDISNPRAPSLRRGFVCPASQSDVSVFRNLLFISGEGLTGRLDCGTQGVQGAVSPDRLRGLRIFDISDPTNPRNVGNVQTCRGSHTHTVLVDPRDTLNVYVYISGSSNVRSPDELPGCINAPLQADANTALFRLEVIRVPLARPEQAAIVSSPRVFSNLTPVPVHGLAPDDIAAAARAAAEARARGAFTATINGVEGVLNNNFVNAQLDSIVRARGGSGSPTGADSATLRAAIPAIVAAMGPPPPASRPGPTQCHDITVYPAMGIAGGACEGYGFLLDIRDPVNPVRITAVADSNFSYWHSATFNNDGNKVLFTDEWGGGASPKCRASDPYAWGANAIFTIQNSEMTFGSYYKLPAAQTAQENCVAHNGSLIPIPGRDVMVQAWYQGGISVFDWTDATQPFEIAYFDRGPLDATQMRSAGSWSAYWYNGVIVSSEIARGLDILELVPSQFITQNEIDAAKTVTLDYLNVQGQPKFTWPNTFVLARAYVDQLERKGAIAAARVSTIRQALATAERAEGAARRSALAALGAQLDTDERNSTDPAKVRMLAATVRSLSGS